MESSQKLERRFQRRVFRLVEENMDTISIDSLDRLRKQGRIRDFKDLVTLAAEYGRSDILDWARRHGRDPRLPPAAHAFLNPWQRPQTGMSYVPGEFRDWRAIKEWEKKHAALFKQPEIKAEIDQRLRPTVPYNPALAASATMQTPLLSFAEKAAQLQQLLAPASHAQPPGTRLRDAAVGSYQGYRQLLYQAENENVMFDLASRPPVLRLQSRL